jgi:hypothetical protein
MPPNLESVESIDEEADNEKVANKIVTKMTNESLIEVKRQSFHTER